MNIGTENSENRATPDQKAAHVFLTELRTRIATERLPFSDGDEQTALNSLVALFAFARKTISEHYNCNEFTQIVLPVLNGPLRNFTAEWHRRTLSGELNTRDGAVIFRKRLRDLQDTLRSLAAELHKLAYNTPMAAYPREDSDDDSISDKIQFGIPNDNLVSVKYAEKINESEEAEIRKRRSLESEDKIYDATGLALSGGGIRSASFCLGVAQCLAKKKLLARFDLMSTVSGGGYTGAFLTRHVSEGSQDAIATPEEKDTAAVQHLRRRAAYLRNGNLNQLLSTAMNLFAGMLINWTAPAAVISVIVCLLYFLINPIGLTALWAQGHVLGSISAVLALVIYAWTRTTTGWRSAALWGLWSTAGILIAAYLLQKLYQHFSEWMIMGDYQLTISMGAVVAATFPVISRFIPVLGQDWLRRLGNLMVLAIASVALPVLAVLLAFTLYWTAGQSFDWPQFLTSTLGDWLAFPTPIHGFWLLLVIALGLSLTALFALDINKTGPHGLYRERLKRTFVSKADGELKTDDDIELFSLDPNAKAPYLLINAVVNLPSSSKVELHERKGDFFLFSKHWSGSPVVGYQKTNRWKLGEKEVGLATAIATSGAAVSPHMALWSISSARALLSFINLRLGLWIRSPIDRASAFARQPGARELVKEMTGFGMAESDEWLLLTDGGHLDNSAAYELLRRRCRFIVAVDGSADPNGEFDTVMTLVRHARLDMGIEIKCGLDELRTDPATGLAPAHGVLCRIVYPECPDTVCLLLVIKLSMTGNEPELVHAYKRQFPEFPNQPTSDQFFNEHQFEAYRRLGAHAADSLFHKVLVQTENSPVSIADWLTRLNCTIPPIDETQ